MVRRRKTPTEKSRLHPRQRLNRRLLQEALEPRALMDAAGPRLIAVNPDAGKLFSFVDASQNRLEIAPTELTLRFDPGRILDPLGGPDISSTVDAATLAQGVSIVYSTDSTFDPSDQTLTPGFLGLDDQGRIVTFRFAETAADGFYRIQVDGELFNQGGLSATPQTVDFELALGARVISVVPQPISRLANGTLSQRRDQIEVYFNNDDLIPSLAQTTAFYRLILTSDTIRNTDDQVFQPISVIYDAGLDRAILTFASDLSTLIGGNGSGTLRLRIGNLEPQPLPPLEQTIIADPGSSFAKSLNLAPVFDTGAVLRVGTGAQINDGGSFSVSLPNATAPRLFYMDDASVIGPPSNVPSGAVLVAYLPTDSAFTIANNIAVELSTLPSVNVTATGNATAAEIRIVGDTGLAVNLGTSGLALATRGLVITSEINNQGQRYPLTLQGASTDPGERQYLLSPTVLARADTQDGVATLYYNFASAYGFDAQLNALPNATTPARQQRFREVMSLLADVIGVQFVETSDRGFQLVSGDLRAIDVNIDTGFGGPLLAHRVSDIDPSRGLLILDSGETWDDSFGTSNTVGRPSFFETAMRGVLNLLGVADSFDLPPGETIAGTGSAPAGPNSNTFNQFSGPQVLRRGNAVEPDYPGDIESVRAQHLYRAESKDIDLYRFSVQQPGVLTAETFAERLPAGSLLNTALILWKENPDGSRTRVARNDDYFGTDAFVELNLAQGTYFLGVSAAGNEDYNPTIGDTGIGGTTEGAYQLRLGFRPDVSLAIRDVDGGSEGGTALDGNADGIPGGAYDFWFRTAPLATPGNAGQPRTLLVDKQAVAGNGTIATPFNNVGTALTAARKGDVVRIVGNAGADGLPGTLTDNFAYQFRNAVVTDPSVSDGATLDVPAGVTVMVDAGALFKLRQTRIAVGSSDPAITADRSGAAFQVLGTPYLSGSNGAPLLDSMGQRVPGWVYFTSYDDQTIGSRTNSLDTVAARGQWGGIEFQNDIDISLGRERLEREGLFLNYVNHADLRYGGGTVQVDGNPRRVRPVQMIDARPTISYNRIAESNDGAMGASPNSFAESNFNDPTSALPGSSAAQQYPFTSDLRRVGPSISSNDIRSNTFNSLMVDIVTSAGGPQRTLTGSTRWDDTDIVHVVTANLIIEGQPGGAQFAETAPAVTTVTSTALPGANQGSLAAGTYRYRLTFVTARGGESPASHATAPLNLAAVGGIRLNNLPVASGQFVSRNLYRNQADGTWVLVKRLDASTTDYVDNGVIDQGFLRRNTPVSGDVTLIPQAGGQLTPGTYHYRLVTVAPTSTTEASLPTRSLTISGNPNATGGPGNGTIRLTGLPIIQAGEKLQIYRLVPTTGDYQLVTETQPGVTTFIDTGASLFNVVNEVEANDTLATAQNLTAQAFGTLFDANIANSTTLPHLTINATGNGTFDYYRFNVSSAGTIGSFDIDSANFDTELFLYDLAGNLLANNDNASLDPGSNSAAESRFGFTFTAAGDFILGVGAFNSFGTSGGIVGQTPLAGAVYQLHLSLSDKIVPNVTNSVLPVNALGVELARPSGRLTIDPAIVVKLEGSRIETTFGGDLYAEAIEGREIIFTSLLDDSYGRGGTFDTTNNGNAVSPTPGKWSGLYFGPLSDGSLENVRLSYAGGISPTGGSFAGFNAVEVHQADVRIARSTFADNGSGLGGQLGTPLTSNFPTDTSSLNPVGNPATRGAHGFNAAATIFVRGAQPTIVENVIKDGSGAAISINANALVDRTVTDPGRVIGGIAARTSDLGNRGPLVRDNLLGGNLLDGMVVRSETQTTSTVWDDTDITHLLFGEIIVPDFHHEGGLTLSSRPGESLVIKAFGPQAGITTLGRPLDITDRIGGAVQIQGQSGFPVLITSLFDDTIGAGFGFDGRALTDTFSSGTGTAAPGDWNGIRLEEYTHDRNVAVITEVERFDKADANTTSTAQNLGLLAKDEKSSDENLRLGFQISGLIAGPGDVDIYNFQGIAGTEVWLDIDRTAGGLDTIVELLDGNGNLSAISDNSYFEGLNPAVYPGGGLSVTARPLSKSIGESTDLDSTNPKDAGMRVVLPGSVGSSLRYYVRVRSSSIDINPSSTAALDQTARAGLTNPANLTSGLTAGRYQLNVRLRETDEVPGASLRLADIRFGTIGLSILGGPTHSPLGGEAAEINTGGADNNGTFATADNLGNLNQSDRAALSVEGRISAGQGLDFYQFFVQPTTLRTPQDPPDAIYTPVTIDLDYADAYGRANTSIALFDNQGRLIAIGTDSNIADDQGSPLQGSDAPNLSAGSAGVLDASLGPIELLSDGPSVGGTVGAGQAIIVAEQGTIVGRWYTAAVHSVATVPAVLDQYTNPNSANADVRLIPNDAIRLLATDDFRNDVAPATATGVATAFTSLADQRYTADQPIYENPFADEGYNGVVPFTLSDVTLFVSLNNGITGNNQSTLVSVNPYTGSRIALLGQSPQPTADVGVRRDGELFTISTGNNVNPTNQATTGNYVNLEPSVGAIDIGSNAGDDSLSTPGLNPDNSRYIFSAMAFERDPLSQVNDNGRFLGVSARVNAPILRNFFGFNVPSRNIVYSMLTSSGLATNQTINDGNLDRPAPANAAGPYQGTGSNKREMGVIDTSRGLLGTPGVVVERTITGLAQAQDPADEFTYYAVDDQGGLYTFNLNVFLQADQTSLNGGIGNLVFDTTFLGVVAGEGLQGLTFGPRDVEFGGSTLGAHRDTLFAISADGTMYAFNTIGQGAPVFSGGRSQIETDFLGNGTVTGLAFSTLERNLFHTTTDRGNDNSNQEDGHGQFDTPTETRARAGSTGGTSLYFGVEIDGNEDNNVIDRDAGTNGSTAPGGAVGNLISKSLDLTDYAVADRPTLYFNYYLETEGTDFDDDGNNASLMRDAFRVFASGDDGVWRLLVTNDSFRNPVATDEFDYVTVNNTIVQEVFDNRGTWRQARGDLSPFAGNENVRLRFEFTTHGGSDFAGNPDLVELVGIRGSRITDGDTFTLTDDGAFDAFGDDRTRTFEFDSGITLTLPAGAGLTVGQTLVLTRTDTNSVATSTTFEFLNPGGLVSNPLFVPIFFIATDTAGQVAAATANAIVAAPSFSDAVLNVTSGRLQLGFSLRTDVILEQGPATITVANNVLRLPPVQQLIDGDTFILRRGSETSRVTLVQSAGVVNPNQRIIPFDSAIDTAADVADRAFDAVGSFFTGIIGDTITLLATTQITTLPGNVLYTNGELQFPNGNQITDLEELNLQLAGALTRVIFDVSPPNAQRAAVAYFDNASTNATIAATVRGLLTGFALDPNQAGINADQIRLLPQANVLNLPNGATFANQVLTLPGPFLIAEADVLQVNVFGSTLSVYFDNTMDPSVNLSVVNLAPGTTANTLATNVGAAVGPLVTVNGNRLQLAAGVTLLQKPLNVTLFGGSIQFPPPNLLADPSQLGLVNGAVQRTLLFTTTASPILSTRIFVDPITDSTAVVAERIGTALGAGIATVTASDIQLNAAAIVVTPVPAGLTYVQATDLLTVTDLTMIPDQAVLEVELNGVIQRLEFDRNGLINSTEVTLVGFNNSVDTNAIIGARLAVGFGDFAVGGGALGAGAVVQLLPGTTLLSAPAGFQQVGNTLQIPNVALLRDGQLIALERIGMVRRVELNDDILDPTRTRVVAVVVNYALTDSPSTLGTRVATALGVLAGNVSGGTIQLVTGDPDTLTLAAPANALVSGGAGVTPGNIAVYVNAGMTPQQVAQAIQNSLPQAFGGETLTYKRFEERLQLPRFFIDDAGPLGSQTGNRQGDEFGDFGSPRGSFGSAAVNNRGDANNAVEGLYIDDVMVGFAERGELVLNAPINANFIDNPEVIAVLRGVDPDDEEGPQNPLENEIITGGYQLEVRTSSGYAVPWEPRQIIPNLALDNSGVNYSSQSGRSIDTNDRLTDAVTLVIGEPGIYRDGDLITLSDGTDIKNFEIVDVNLPGSVPAQGNIPVFLDQSQDTRETLAEKIRDAINSPDAQGTLNIQAQSTDSRETNASGSHRIDLFGTDVLVYPTVGQNIYLDLVSREVLTPADPFQPTTTDTLRRAVPTGYQSGALDTLLVNGRLGDRALLAVDSNFPNAASLDDSDLVRIHLNAGETIDIDVDSFASNPYQSGIAPLIRVYDQQGNILVNTAAALASAVPADAPGESLVGDGYVQFTAPVSGDFIVELRLDVSLTNSFTNEPRTNFPASPTGMARFSTITRTANVATVVTQGPHGFTSGDIASIDAQNNSFDGFAFITVVNANTFQYFSFGANIPVAPDNGVATLFNFLVTATHGIDDYITDYNLTIRPTTSRDVVSVDLHRDHGDTNRFRDQGQLIIEGITIRDSANFGIAVSAGRSNLTQYGPLMADLPRPGATRQLRNLNVDELLPGPVLINNVLDSNRQGGISIAGGVNIDDPAMFVRVVNNTIFGAGQGTGISVTGSASPTLLNNVLLENVTGIQVSGTTAQSTVLGSNLYSLNPNPVVGTILGAFDFDLDANPTFQQLVFEDAVGGNFLPAVGSLAIDSSQNSLDDRQAFLENVKQPVGIGPSPILAPGVDALGLTRVDDSGTQSSIAQGDNLFVDRGAIDRADDRPPESIIIVPADNDAALVDGDFALTKILYLDPTGQGLRIIEIRITEESGTGPDPTTITTANLILYQNGAPLREGLDYTFGYNPSSRTVRLTPAAGLFSPFTQYDLVLNNGRTPTSSDLPASGFDLTNPITDLVGLRLEPNRSNLESRYTIVIRSRPPLIRDDVFTGIEDGGAITGNVFADNGFGADVDPDGGTLSISTLVLNTVLNDPVRTLNGNPVAAGTLTLLSDGSMTFVPVADYYTLPNQPLTFTYSAFDSDGAPSVHVDASGRVGPGLATVSIVVQPVNDRPSNIDDGPIVMLEDELFRIRVSTLVSNDFVGAPFEETQILTLIPTSVAAVNDATVQAPITASIVTILGVDFVEILPQQHANGISKFIYRVRDDGGTALGGADEAAQFATVTLDIRAVNDAPVPDEDAHLARNYFTDEDVPLTAASNLKILVADILADDDPAPNRTVEKAIDELPAIPSNPRAQSLVLQNVEIQTENGGSAVLVGGEIHYTPPANFFGTDAIFYTIRDVGPNGSIPENFVRTPNGIISQPTAISTRGRITLTVNPVNDPPRFTPTSFTILEDSILDVSTILGVIRADSGPNESDLLLLTPANGTSANNGTVTITPALIGNDFNLRYVPPPSFFGSDTITLQLTDQPPVGPLPQMAAKTTLVTLTVTVRPVNDAPVTVNDVIHILEDVVADIPASLIVANDRVDPFNDGSLAREDRSDAQNVPQTAVRVISAIALNSPAGTNVEVLLNGSVRITPPANYYTRDRTGIRVADPLTIRYTASDGGSSFIQSPPGSGQYIRVSDARTADGTITVDVWPVNDAPVGRNRSFLDVFEDTPYTINASQLLLRTSDLVNGFPPPVTKDSAGPREDVGPDNIFSTTGAFPDVGLSQTTSIIEPDSQNPNVLSLPTQRGGSVNFIDLDINQPGFERLVYVPPQDFASVTTLNQTDSVVYRIADNGFSYQFASGVPASLTEPSVVDDVLASTGTITFSINPVNDPPEFGISGNVNVLEDAVVLIPNYATGIRPGPLAAVDEATQSVIFRLEVNNPNLFVLAGPDNKPDIQILPNGTLRARLSPNANGQAIVRVRALDNFVLDSAGQPDEEATGVFPRVPPDVPVEFTFTVAAVNDPPEFTIPTAIGTPPGPFTVTVNEDAGLTQIAVASGILPGPDPVTSQQGEVGEATDERSQVVRFIAELVNSSQVSLFDLEPTISNDGQLRFSTRANVFTSPGQPILIRVRARDDGPSTTGNFPETQPITIAINVNAVNDPPVPNNDPSSQVTALYRTSEDAALHVDPLGILINDTDVEGHPMRVVGLGTVGGLTGLSALGGTVVLGANGSVDYNSVDLNGTPLPIVQALTTGQTLTDRFTYRISDDQQNNSASLTLGTVTITLTGVNDAPVIAEQTIRAGRDRPTTINIAGFTSDIDSAINLSSIQIVSEPTEGTLQIRNDGTVVYQPRSGFLGTDQFSVTIADSLGGRSAPVTMLLQVSNIPVGLADTARTYRNNPLPIRINVLANDVSSIGTLDPSSVQITVDPVNGSVQRNSDGTISYLPARNFAGSDQFFYTVRDLGSNGQSSDPTRVTVLVAGSLGQNPIINADVDNSGEVSPIDALLPINHLNNGSQTNVILLAAAGTITLEDGPYLDVDGNGFVQPLDSLIVINVLNKRASGESVVAPSSESREDAVFAIAHEINETMPGLRFDTNTHALISEHQSFAQSNEDAYPWIADEEEDIQIENAVDAIFDLF